jgi:hypothetical protein
LFFDADFYEELGSKKIADIARSGVVDGGERTERGFVVQTMVWHIDGAEDLPGREDSRVSLVKELVTPEGHYELLESREIEQGVVASWFEPPKGC